MIITFPLISFGLCAWMTVFGFYLKLEERAWIRIKKKKKKEKLEKILTSQWIKSHSKEDLTEVYKLFVVKIIFTLKIFLQSLYDLCSSSIQQGRGKLPQQKSLEDILKQELAWTLEEVRKPFCWVISSTSHHLDWRRRREYFCSWAGNIHQWGLQCRRWWHKKLTKAQSEHFFISYVLFRQSLTIAIG